MLITIPSEGREHLDFYAGWWSRFKVPGQPWRPSPDRFTLWLHLLDQHHAPHRQLIRATLDELLAQHDEKHPEATPALRELG